MMRSVFIDLEFNTTSAGHSIIEIGACLGDREFQSYVFTDRKLIRRVVKLTGITQEQVCGAPVFGDVMDRFFTWLGDDFEAIYSWSMVDRDVLLENCALQGYSHPMLARLTGCWRDAQAEFAQELHYDRMSQVPSLSNAVRALEISPMGREHTALVDAWDARAVLLALSDPRRESMVRALQELFLPKEEHLTFSFAALLSPLTL